MDIPIPEGMTDAAMFALIVGFLSPLVLNLIVKATWRPWAKSVTAFLWSVVVGSLTAWFAGAFTGLGVISTILLVLVVSITAYQNFWKQVAPSMQRGSNEKAVNEAQEQVDEIRSIAAPIATAQAQAVIEATPVVSVAQFENQGDPLADRLTELRPE